MKKFIILIPLYNDWESVSKLLDQKVIILGSGDNSIRFRPHLNVIKKDIDIAIEKIVDAIKLMLN